MRCKYLPFFLALMIGCHARSSTNANKNQQQNNDGFSSPTEFEALLRRAQTLMRKMKEEVTSGGELRDNANKTVALVLMLLETECQLSSILVQKHSLANAYGTKENEPQQQFSKFNELNDDVAQFDTKKLVDDLTDAIEKEVPKMVEAMKMAETMDTVSIDGVYGTVAEILGRTKPYPTNLVRLHTYAEAVNLLRMVSQKMDEGSAKDTVTKMLAKRTVALGGDDTVVGIMPSDLVQLTSDLWTRTPLKEVLEAASQQQWQQNIRDQVHRTSKRFPSRHTSRVAASRHGEHRQRRSPPPGRRPSPHLIHLLIALAQILAIAYIGSIALSSANNGANLFSLIIAIAVINVLASVRAGNGTQPPKPLFSMPINLNISTNCHHHHMHPFGGLPMAPPQSPAELSQRLAALRRLLTLLSARANAAATGFPVSAAGASTTSPAPDDDPNQNNNNDNKLSDQQQQNGTNSEVNDSANDVEEASDAAVAANPTDSPNGGPTTLYEQENANDESAPEEEENGTSMNLDNDDGQNHLDLTAEPSAKNGDDAVKDPRY